MIRFYRVTTSNDNACDVKGDLGTFILEDILAVIHSLLVSFCDFYLLTSEEAKRSCKLLETILKHTVFLFTTVYNTTGILELSIVLEQKRLKWYN